SRRSARPGRASRPSQRPPPRARRRGRARGSRRARAALPVAPCAEDTRTGRPLARGDAASHGLAPAHLEEPLRGPAAVAHSERAVDALLPAQQAIQALRSGTDAVDRRVVEVRADETGAEDDLVPAVA